MKNTKRNTQYAILIVLILVCLTLPQARALAATTSQISQFGITWTFDKNYTVGQFANGDYWVVGPVNIIGIDPPSIEIDGRTKNGSMINPSPAEGVYPGHHGWDSIITYYDANKNVALEVNASNPLVVPVNSSLVSCISDDVQCTKATCGYNEYSWLDDVAVLTVLAESPAANSFRPPYCGTDKTIKFNKSDLNYALLGSLNPNVTTPPSDINTVAKLFERPWLDYWPGSAGRTFHPSNNMEEYGLSICTNISIGALMLNCNFTNAQKETLMVRFVQLGIDLYGISQSSGGNLVWVPDGGHGGGRKWPILFAGLVLNDNGMKNIGQKSGDYLYSGSYGAGNPPPDYIHFGEDSQTFYVKVADVYSQPYTLNAYHGSYTSGTATCTKGSTSVVGVGTTWESIDPLYDTMFGAQDAEGYDPDGAAYNISSIDSDTALTLTESYRGYSADPDKTVYTGLAYVISDFVYYGHASTANTQEYNEYASSNLGLPEWGARHALYPVQDGLDWDAAYRGTWHTYYGIVLSALIMDGKTLWNHNNLFDYQDRYMAIEVQSGQWPMDMWNVYRADYGCVWTRDDPTDIYSQGHYVDCQTTFLYGDVSGNGEVSSYDAALTAQYSVGLITLTPDQIKAADVSGNGEVSAYDAALIAQKAVGLIEKFPVEL